MIAFQPRKFSTYGVVDPPEPSVWDVFRESFQAGRQMSFQEQSSYLANSLILQNQAEEEKHPLLPVEELKRKYNAPGLEWKNPEYDQVAKFRFDNHQEELSHQYYLQNVPKGLFGILPALTSVQSYTEFAGSLLGGMSKPMDFLITMVPVVGQAAKVGQVGQAAVKRGLVTRALSRGIIRNEAVPFIEKYPKLLPSVINNSVQQMIIETPQIIKEIRDEGRADIPFHLRNLVAGAVQAEVFRYGLEAASRVIGVIHAKSVGKAISKAVDDIITGKDVDVSRELLNDPNVLRDGVEAQETARVTNQALVEERANWEKQWNETVSKLDEAKANVAKLEAQYEEAKARTKDVYPASRITEIAKARAMESWVEIKAAAKAASEVLGNFGRANEANLQRIYRDWLPVWEAQGKDVTIQKKLYERYAAGDRTANLLENMARQVNLEFDPNYGIMPKVYHLADKTNNKSAVELPLSSETQMKVQLDEIGRARSDRFKKAVDEEMAWRVEKFKQEEMDRITTSLKNQKFALAGASAEVSRLEGQKAQLERAEPPRPEVSTPQKVKAATPSADPSKPMDVGYMQEITKDVEARLGELTAEEKAYLDETDMVDDAAAEIIKSAIPCIVKNG